MTPNWENKILVSQKIGKGKEESEEQSRKYWNLILEDWTSTGIDRTGWEDENKPSGKLDLTLENVIAILITLEIAEGEFHFFFSYDITGFRLLLGILQSRSGKQTAGSRTAASI